jgi:uncharacterized membrane protein
MRSSRSTQDTSTPQPLRGAARTRWEEQRPRSSGDDTGYETLPSSLRASTLVAMAGVLLAAFVVVMLTLPEGVAAQVIQQTPSITAGVERGKVTVSVDEVRTKKIVYWDYRKADGTTIPLMAYRSPSGLVKMAVRACEPCEGYSFRIEGEQLVCNTSGTRWDLDTLKGISGDWQDYPPSLLRTSVADGDLTVDEARVARWTPRT